MAHSWLVRTTDCGLDPFHTRRSHSPNEGPALESEITDEYDRCVLIHYYTTHERVFVPMIIDAGAGPHQLPEGDHGDGDFGEERLQALSVDDSTEIDHPETGSPRDVLDEVIHNAPQKDLHCWPLGGGDGSGEAS